jgi:coronin-1B/1C/6
VRLPCDIGADRTQLHENEIMRAYKTVNDSYIEPISFTVPRRAETFQSDIYPPAVGLKPAMSAKEWLSGKTATAPKIDLESVYEGNGPVEAPADYKPPPMAAAAPASKPTPRKEPEPSPVATRSPPPSMSDQKQSISAMANKFHDDDDDDDDEAETSSFEEVGRPQPRGSVPVRSQPKPLSPVKSMAPAQAKPSSPVKSPPSSWSPPATRQAPASSSGSGLEGSLQEIKQLLIGQNKIINAQSEQISLLTSEVESLKKRIGSGSYEQNERIRQLELELEEARS